MKKILSLMLAAVLALGIVSPALAKTVPDYPVRGDAIGMNISDFVSVDLDNNLPHHSEVAAGMLQGDHKLEYRKFDVSYDFHFDKLYEYNPAPNAPLRETTL